MFTNRIFLYLMALLIPVSSQAMDLKDFKNALEGTTDPEKVVTLIHEACGSTDGKLNVIFHFTPNQKSFIFMSLASFDEKIKCELDIKQKVLTVAHVLNRHLAKIIDDYITGKTSSDEFDTLLGKFNRTPTGKQDFSVYRAINRLLELRDTDARAQKVLAKICKLNKAPDKPNLADQHTKKTDQDITTKKLTDAIPLPPQTDTKTYRAPIVAFTILSMAALGIAIYIYVHDEESETDTQDANQELESATDSPTR